MVVPVEAAAASLRIQPQEHILLVALAALVAVVVDAAEMVLVVGLEITSEAMAER
jgi:hypothetical protein